jgi:hypothetical protein
MMGSREGFFGSGAAAAAAVPGVGSRRSLAHTLRASAACLDLEDDKKSCASQLINKIIIHKLIN